MKDTDAYKPYTHITHTHRKSQKYKLQHKKKHFKKSLFGTWSLLKAPHVQLSFLRFFFITKSGLVEAIVSVTVILAFNFEMKLFCYSKILSFLMSHERNENNIFLISRRCFTREICKAEYLFGTI